MGIKAFTLPTPALKTSSSSMERTCASTVKGPAFDSAASVNISCATHAQTVTKSYQVS